MNASREAREAAIERAVKQVRGGGVFARRAAAPPVCGEPQRYYDEDGEIHLCGTYTLPLGHEGDHRW